MSSAMRTRPARRSGDLTLRWDNFVSFFDPVSGALRSFADWGTIANHRLLGGGFFRGHVVYERSPVFLESPAPNGVCTGGSTEPRQQGPLALLGRATRCNQKRIRSALGDGR